LWKLLLDHLGSAILGSVVYYDDLIVRIVLMGSSSQTAAEHLFAFVCGDDE